MKLTVAALGLGLLAGTAAAEEMAPFVIPMTPNDSSLIATSLPPIPVDAERLVARDGHFYVGQRRVRIWGVNICFGACFPTHADAERVAGRLAAAGVNSVRFHHMDTDVYPRGILDPKDRLKIHPEALERLDYFLDQLARRGIYANINLHVGREASKALGLPQPNTKYDKVVGIFVRELIEAQRQYARDLLTHVNAYRKVRYADDPAVAFVEITNEDSLFMWSARADLQSLPEFYAKILQEQYAAWLKGRYGTTDGLRAAWLKGAERLGASMIADPKFEMPAAPDSKAARWQIEVHQGNAAKLVHPADNPAAARLEISQANETNWHLQLKQSPLSLKAGQFYTLAFRARADQPRSISYTVGQAHDPWQGLGLSGTGKLTPQWRLFRAGFVASGSDADARLSFSFGGSTIAVEIADAVLAPGGREGLRPDENIEAATVALYGTSEVEARAIDRVKFLAETEKKYFDGMLAFIKKDLGSKALVTGTIVFGPLGMYGQSGMDYIDSHAYWQHPQFPGRPWDPANWTVVQEAMTDRPEQATLPRIAAERMEGRPFTLSEYNHPAPLDFQEECVPLVAAYAAAQDWDGIWLFAYSHRGGEVDRDAFGSYFDIDANPSKWGFMRAGAAIFRDGALPPFRRGLGVAIADENVLGELAAAYLKHDRNMVAVINEKMEAGWAELVKYRMEVSLSGHSGVVDSERQTEPTLTWKVDDRKRGVFTASGPGAIVFVGHAGAAEAAAASGVELVKPDFAAVTVTALDARPLAESKSILVTACGKCENTGMQFTPDRRSVGRNWGKGPVCIEPVDGRVLLPAGAWQCRSLKPDGTPAADVPLAKDDKGRPVLRLTPESKTMWYLLTPAAEKK